jgi:hypothetical protein
MNLPTFQSRPVGYQHLLGATRRCATLPKCELGVQLVQTATLTQQSQDILYSGGELTRPCLGNIRLTSIQSRIVPRSGPSMRESQHV